MEEQEKLDVYEARQINKVYDDDWRLLGYTAELRNNSDDSFFCFVDFSGDVGEIRYCEHCESYGFKNKLGQKIKKKGDAPAPDDDQWLSCYECGNTFPIYSAKIESKIKDFVETTDNPFEGNKATFLSTDSRREQRRKGKKPKTRFSRKFDNPDPDIQREIDKGNSVHIIQ